MQKFLTSETQNGSKDFWYGILGLYFFPDFRMNEYEKKFFLVLAYCS